MTFEIDAGGKRRRIDVRRTGQSWAVTIDGRTVTVDWDGRSLLIASGAAGPLGDGDSARSYEIAIGDDNGTLDVHVDGIAVPVSVVDPRRAWTRTGHEHAGADGPRQVLAPMPGRIVKMLVKAGDAVTARQALIVVEAMKMENELRSPRDGTVSDVRVSEGMSVEAHAILLVVE